MTLTLIVGGLVSLALLLMGWAGASIGGDPRSRIKRQAPFLLGAGLAGLALTITSTVEHFR